MNIYLTLFIAFLVKHFIVDFVVQTPYMYLNKGKLLHPGGWVHAGLHGFASLIVFMMLTPIALATVCFSLVFAEICIHFTIDCLKVNIGKRYGLTATNSEWFWILLGLDQLLHGLTYVWMIFMVL